MPAFRQSSCCKKLNLNASAYVSHAMSGHMKSARNKLKEGLIDLNQKNMRIPLICLRENCFFQLLLFFSTTTFLAYNVTVFTLL